MRAFANDLLYSPEHIWVHVDGNLATIGITDFPQEVTGEMYTIHLSEPNDYIERDELFGSIEAAKGVIELISPLTGEIVSVNEDIVDDIEVINSGPLDVSWLIVVDISEASELDDLMSPSEYQEYIGRGQ